VSVTSKQPRRAETPDSSGAPVAARVGMASGELHTKFGVVRSCLTGPWDHVESGSVAMRPEASGEESHRAKITYECEKDQDVIDIQPVDLIGMLPHHIRKSGNIVSQVCEQEY
jgi:hypothetical protein